MHTYCRGFFENWTPSMAYVLGFIAADGWISINTKNGKGSYRLGVFVNEKDREVVEFIKKSMNLSHEIKTKATNLVGLEICSKKLISDIQVLGIVPCKSKLIKMPRDIPKQCISHYVRGLFDGDGWITVADDYFYCGIVSASDGFLEQIRDAADCGGRIYHRKSGGFKRKDGVKTIMHTLKYTKHDTIRFRDFLYHNECFSLSRKRSKFYDNRVRIKNKAWTPEEVAFLMKNWNQPIGWLSRRMKRSEGTIIQKRFRINGKQTAHR